VREVVFLGPHRAVIVAGVDGRAVTVYVPHMPSGDGPPEPGARVGVSWAEQDAWIVPEGTLDG
jgi:hypothetical protein